MRAISPGSKRLAGRGRDAADGLRIGVLAGRQPQNGRMPEDRLCRRLAEAGRAGGVEVIIFGPEGVRIEDDGIRTDGWVLTAGRWQPVAASAPLIVFDRRFPRTAAEEDAGRRAVHMLQRHGTMLLGRSLPDKLQVMAALSRCRVLVPLLPETARFIPGRLAEWLRAWPDGLFLKPAAGMQGRGTAAVMPEREAGCFRISGRTTMHNTAFERRVPAASLAHAAAALTRGRPYLIQPLLKLRTPAGEPFDLRLFVQKDGGGRWRVTGAAVRIGRPGDAASNLHGGGTARPAGPFLEAMLGRTAAERTLRKAKRAALIAARQAERSFGRLAEIGADFGIEPDGRLWLLELNAKPGRAIFHRAGDEAGERLAAERTIAYGLRLLAAKLPAAGSIGIGHRPAGKPAVGMADLRNSDGLTRRAARLRARCMNGTTAYPTHTMQEVQP